MFALLKKMGYDSVMVWPLLEAIPMPLSPSDASELQAYRLILQDGRDAGLRIYMSQCANLTTPPSLASVPWRLRNPYPVFRTINFSNSIDTTNYLAHRRELLTILNNADGYVTIDGDPGGYAGAAPQDFVNVFLNDFASITQGGTNPAQQQVIPWIWTGWGQKGPWAAPIEPFVRAELDLLTAQLPRNWAVMPGRLEEGNGCGRTNMGLTQTYKLESRSTLMLYDAIEPEPSPPSPNLKFADIRSFLRDEADLYRAGAGVMGNVQTPLMKLPSIYFFGRAAKDPSYLNRSDDEILNDFAAFLGGPPGILRPAWKCCDLQLAQLPADLPAQIRAVSLTGEPAAMIPGGATRYLDLLAAQVESRRRILAAMTLPHSTDADAAAVVAEGVDAAVCWWNRHHFVQGNDPGAPFSWEFVHWTEYRPFQSWAVANIGSRDTVVVLAAQALVKRGTLTEPTATATVRNLLNP